MEVIEIGPDRQNVEIAQQKSSNDICRRSAINFKYDEFFTQYMCQNQAIIICSTADQWECFNRWSCSGTIDYDYLRTTIGDMKVPVADCGKQYFDSHEKLDMNFFDYLDYFEKANGEQPRMLYLKDWHLRKLLPEYEFYNTPKYFASDWLNEYLQSTNQDDYIWSTNIFGIKKWLLLPPGEELKLKDQLGNLPFQVSEELLKSKHVVYHIITQTPGEAIFIPSGWYHQVQNVEDAISVNHNWFNGCNVLQIWTALDNTLDQVMAEIHDCRDMDDFEQHCQVMLKAAHGMSLENFLNLLTFICERRLATLQKIEPKPSVVLFDKFHLGSNHVRFDLEAIRNTLSRMLSNRRDLLENLKLLNHVEKYLSLIDDCFTENSQIG
ncbi:2-oxoglutarate and iron-dependent oxygenase JMJD4 homolog isoform X2 [Uranotaenia lowii]|uniref:2-oxoglutarate and iron-dependent oxygenase JMJD4 homolog isoform X2 n=1 Tax=Uranotaenia lowii TaxID=190385 RepID=UPI0024792B24|nr:2-oxoglutarate and iron-dependent oxygenase JMJD4 homolog isoform X2 [Uranotaenia lowii]